MKISNLLNKDLKIVEKRKKFFLVPLIIVILAAIAMLIYGLALGEPLNLGMDFQGGYTVNVKLSTKLNETTFSEYKKTIEETVEGLKDENGNSYNIKVAAIVRQGSGDTASINVKYKSVASDIVMEDEINPAVQKALQEKIFKIIPIVGLNEGKDTVTINYGSFSLLDSTFVSLSKKITDSAITSNVAVSNLALGSSSKSITFNVSGVTDAFISALTDTATIEDKYSGQAVKGDIISATVSGELLTNAILAICMAIVLMLVYIAFRFEVSSGVAAVVALFHDIIIMFSFMAIFHIEINSTFIAALITILGYSINNTIIIFDRIRENLKSLRNKNCTAATIANRSVRETLLRSINTTITTLITILMVAIIGVTEIRVFALPILIGLISGAFSSVCIAPSVWVMWKDRKRKTPKSENKAEKAEKAALADVK